MNTSTRLSGCLCLAATLCAGYVFGAGEPDFPLLGKIQPRAAKDIASSSWSIGGETLDRDFAIFANYKKYLGPFGAKHIRVQTGWAKCEKQPGVYDFAWLDEVVNDARAQGVQPWLEANYGNTIYPGGGGTGLGGGLPKSPEALAAWDKWVRALVAHFKDRVFEWEIWNEPDLSKGNLPADYAALFIRSARIIRAEQPGATIYALGLAGNLGFAEKFLEEVKSQGQLGLIDAITLHGYPTNPDDTSLADKARALAAKYSPSIRIRQGETGAPSTAATFGALSGHAWTELLQAKWDLRRMLAHHAKDIPFNLFTLMELQYPDRLNTKGLLKSKSDKTVEREKPAYFAAQHVFTLFDDSLERIADFAFTASGTNKLAVTAYRNKSAGGQLVALWFKGAAVAENNATTPVDLAFQASRFTDPVWVDLLDGSVRRIPPANWSQSANGCEFRALPVYDAPVLIAERALIPMVGN